MEDYKYYCPFCDWFFKLSEVNEQTDGISDTTCPDCGKPLQQEGDNNE
jgi:transposase-like protein